jgi:hypothetical protein
MVVVDAPRLRLQSGVADESSIPRAITIVGVIGVEWAVPNSVIEDARRVVRELVENAARHSRRASVLQVSSDPRDCRSQAGTAVQVRPAPPGRGSAWSFPRNELGCDPAFGRHIRVGPPVRQADEFRIDGGRNGG